MAKKSYTEEQKAEILKFAEENTAAAAAKQFGVSAMTINRWKAADKAVAGKIEAKKKTRAAGRKVKEKAEEVKADVAAAAETVADAAVAAEIEVKKETRKTGRKVKEKVAATKEKKAVKTAARKADRKETKAAVKAEAEDQKVAAEIEVKKTVRKAGRKAAEKAGAVKEAAKKPAAKRAAAKLNLVFQSQAGGAVSYEQIAAKVPAGTTDAYVKIEENKIYWVKGEETGSVDIWE